MIEYAIPVTPFVISSLADRAGRCAPLHQPPGIHGQAFSFLNL
jgi:hypothetical protein